MTILANWHRLNRRGPQSTLYALRRMFPQFRLGSISLDGFKDRQYCVKAKGAYGDVLILWR